MAEVKKGDREKTGFDDGSYPVSTEGQCMSAIRLRHNSKKGHSAEEVLAHVSRGKACQTPAIKAAIKRARARDTARKTKKKS